ncbi:hypothetical protein BTVI_30652 [Pitangus sulphuratus]|nr:hypothetical protein BTVI_30652 [Pitangus sulphuratus]
MSLAMIMTEQIHIIEFKHDGSYLAEFLLEKGYEVHGIVRRSSSFNTGRIEHLYKNPQAHIEGNMKLHYGDLTDSTCLVKIINEVKPSEIYNLGAQSHVKIVVFAEVLNYCMSLILNIYYDASSRGRIVIVNKIHWFKNLVFLPYETTFAVEFAADQS